MFKPIDNIIIDNASGLEISLLSFKCDPIAILRALAQNESSYGTNNHPRFEPAYYIGGHYYKKDATLRKLVNQYGKMASASHSSWQIMFSNAIDLGFVGSPEDLDNDSIAIRWIVKYVNKRIFKRSPTKLEDIFDAYNSGSFRDSIIPAKYIADGLRHYQHFIENPISTSPIVYNPEVKVSIMDKIEAMESAIATLTTNLQELKESLKEK